MNCVECCCNFLQFAATLIRAVLPHALASGAAVIKKPPLPVVGASPLLPRSEAGAQQALCPSAGLLPLAGTGRTALLGLNEGRHWQAALDLRHVHAGSRSFRASFSSSSASSRSRRSSSSWRPGGRRSCAPRGLRAPARAARRPRPAPGSASRCRLGASRGARSSASLAWPSRRSRGRPRRRPSHARARRGASARSEAGRAGRPRGARARRSPLPPRRPWSSARVAARPSRRGRAHAPRRFRAPCGELRRLLLERPELVDALCLFAELVLERLEPLQLVLHLVLAERDLGAALVQFRGALRQVRLE